jgi:hypothetical protein
MFAHTAQLQPGPFRDTFQLAATSSWSAGKGMLWESFAIKAGDTLILSDTSPSAAAPSYLPGQSREM